MQTMQDIKKIEFRIQELEHARIMVCEWWKQLLLCARNQEEYESTLTACIDHMEEYRRTFAKLYNQREQLIEHLNWESLMQEQESDQNGSMDGQESTTTTETQPEIEPKAENEQEQIDVKKSDDEMNQIIESVEAEN